VSLSRHSARVHMDIYPSADVVTKFQGCRKGSSGGGARKVITKFSSKSADLCQLRFRAIAHAHNMQVLIGLTYPEEMYGTMTGPESKEHLHRLLKWLKNEEVGPDLVYAWVLEFQPGTLNPHYHILLNRRVDIPRLSSKWFEIVGSGLEKHRNAGTSVQSVKDKTRCMVYVASYLRKIDQKQVPESFQNVGRFWGYSRGAVQKITVEMGYSDRESAKRDTRLLRRSRRARLRGYGIDWKWKGSGFTYRDCGMDHISEVVDLMEGELIEKYAA